MELVCSSRGVVAHGRPSILVVLEFRFSKNLRRYQVVRNLVCQVKSMGAKCEMQQQQQQQPQQ